MEIKDTFMIFYLDLYRDRKKMLWNNKNNNKILLKMPLKITITNKKKDLNNKNNSKCLLNR